MAHVGFVIGLVVPLVLLGVNLVLQYGGILVTVALIVWIGTGILLTPTPEEDR
jgi:amino acid permease